jgi:hypothetical protein
LDVDDARDDELQTPTHLTLSAPIKKRRKRRGR